MRTRKGGFEPAARRERKCSVNVLIDPMRYIRLRLIISSSGVERLVSSWLLTKIVDRFASHDFNSEFFRIHISVVLTVILTEITGIIQGVIHLPRTAPAVITVALEFTAVKTVIIHQRILLHSTQQQFITSVHQSSTTTTHNHHHHQSSIPYRDRMNECADDRMR